jgi:hypothetical protein
VQAALFIAFCLKSDKMSETMPTGKCPKCLQLVALSATHCQNCGNRSFVLKTLNYKEVCFWCRGRAFACKYCDEQGFKYKTYSIDCRLPEEEINLGLQKIEKLQAGGGKPIPYEGKLLQYYPYLYVGGIIIVAAFSIFIFFIVILIFSLLGR